MLVALLTSTQIGAHVLGRFIWNPIGALVVGVLALGLGIVIATGTDVVCKTKTAAMGLFEVSGV